ncbi:MAG: DNA replication/repair protein RecF, partial [Solirubrobacteraceae bacterium]
SLHGWDQQLAGHGVRLMTDRRAALDVVAEHFAGWCAELGLDGEPAVAYRPRSRAEDPGELAAELSGRIDGDVERGFTGHGPHRDEVAIAREGRELRAYGSQGQQRLALLALLLAERDALAAHRQAPPLMLLDDVMSELDRGRREALVGLLRERHGQAVITATDADHVPGADGSGVTRLEIADGRVLAETSV